MHEEWRIESFVGTTHLFISIQTEDQDPDRSNALGMLLKSRIAQVVTEVTVRDAADRVLSPFKGETDGR